MVSRGLYLAPFDELAEPGLLAELAARAEACGWDGVFLWDHVAYRPPVDAIADPWVALAAIACATERIRIGTLVTALSRRRVQKLARETVTLDRLSGGRLVLGVGLGVEGNGELEPFGEVTAPRERARLLDEGLQTLTRLWGGGFSPPPLQPDGIPVWVAARWPNRRPLRRAARWHGLFPTDLPDPAALRAFAEDARALRDPGAAPLELVVELPVGAAPSPWVAGRCHLGLNRVRRDSTRDRDSCRHRGWSHSPVARWSQPRSRIIASTRRIVVSHPNAERTATDCADHGLAYRSTTRRRNGSMS